MANRLGCVFVLLVIAALTVEVYVMLVVSDATNEPFGTLLAVLVMMFAGWRLLRWHAARLPQGMMDGTLGRRAVGLFGAVLLAFPGFVSSGVGLLLQLPPLQRLFAGVAGRTVQRLSRRAAEQMAARGGGHPGGMPGGFGGFPGGGFPGGGFPGMKPDERRGPANMRKGGKRIIDAEFEKKKD